MSELKDITIALNVRLKPSESSAHPRCDERQRSGVIASAADWVANRNALEIEGVRVRKETE